MFLKYSILIKDKDKTIKRPVRKVNLLLPELLY